MHADSMATRLEAAVPAAPLRKVALLLHAMCGADRGWMLDQVDAGQRARLDELLAELGALDFPRDAAFLDAALQDAAPARVVPAARGPAQWSTDDAWRIFQDEPDGVIAAALAAAQDGASWSWESALLRRLGADRAAAVAACRERIAARPRAPALLESVMLAARARFDAAAGAIATTPRRTR